MSSTAPPATAHGDAEAVAPEHHGHAVRKTAGRIRKRRSSEAASIYAPPRQPQAAPEFLSVSLFSLRADWVHPDSPMRELMGEDVMLIDTKCFTDERLARHTGHNADIQLGILKHMQGNLFVDQVLKPVRRHLNDCSRQNRTSAIIGLVCNHGVHRSVGCKEILRIFLGSTAGLRVQCARDLSLEMWPASKPRCACPACDPRYTCEYKERTRASILATVRDMWARMYM